MSKVGTLIRLLHDDENRVAEALHDIAERHRDEHDIFHVARELASWSTEHVRLLRDAAARYGAELPRVERPDHDLLDRVGRDLEQRAGGTADPGMLLLRELREVHLVCVGLSLDWEMLAQTAKALRDDQLLDVANRCQGEAVRQLKWANSRVKEAAPQVMAS